MSALSPPKGKFVPNPKLKLREQLAEVMRFKHFSHRTEQAYWGWIRDFLRFHRAAGTKGTLGAGAGPGAGAPGAAQFPSPQPSPRAGGERGQQWRRARSVAPYHWSVAASAGVGGGGGAGVELDGEGRFQMADWGRDKTDGMDGADGAGRCVTATGRARGQGSK